jgi:hypothetical protein
MIKSAARTCGARFGYTAAAGAVEAQAGRQGCGGSAEKRKVSCLFHNGVRMRAGAACR